MKKILIAALLITSTAMACDAPKQSGVVTLAKTASIFAIAKQTGPIIIAPLLILELSAGQRAYNLKHGIHHSREEKKRSKSSE